MAINSNGKAVRIVPNYPSAKQRMEEFDKMSPAMRQYIRNFPTSVSIAGVVQDIKERGAPLTLMGYQRSAAATAAESAKLCYGPDHPQATTEGAKSSVALSLSPSPKEGRQESEV